MHYLRSMQIRPGLRTARASRPQKREKVAVPLVERAVTSAVVGASIGTVGGEMIGGAASVAGIGYAGYRIGQNFGTIGGVVGGIAGAGAAFFVESKVPIGKTVGAATGFVVGGLTGGALGAGLGLVNKLGAAF